MSHLEPLAVPTTARDASTTVPVLVTIGAQVHIQRPGGPWKELTGKVAVLLALLGLEESVERRRAAALLWPDSGEEQARNNLRTLVHRLNGSAGVAVVRGGERLGLSGARVALVPVDADALLSALATQGPRECDLLSGIDDASMDQELSAWLQSARQRLRQRQLKQLREALAEAEAASDAARARALAQACVQIDPFSEHGHRRLMETLAGFGDRAAALAAYERLKALLREHLGVSPDLQTRTVQLRILQDEAFGQQTAPRDSRPTVSSPATGWAGNDGPPACAAAARFALVERDAVLQQVRSALAHGQHVAIEGEAGVGKTRLLHCLTEAADGVHPVAFFASDRHEPYAAVSHLVQSVQPRAAARVTGSARMELARIAPSAFPGTPLADSPLSALRLHDALTHWLQALADVGVQVLVMDDLHHADAASQALLAALLDRPPGDPGRGPAWLMAHRGGEIEPVLEEAMLKSQLASATTRVTLPRLSLQGVQSLLRDIGAEVADAVHYWQRSGGNPLFLIELAQHVLESGGSVVEASDAGLNALLRSRLTACSEPAQQLACVAAIASQDFTVELASNVLGQSLLALMKPWNELQRRGLFADQGLAHDLVREATLGALPPPIARSLHARVAEHLESQGLKGVPVLRHWLAAVQPDRALPHAAHQLHAVSQAGLSTLRLEVDLVDLLNSVSDAVLLDNLWLTAEVGSTLISAFPLPEVWPRLQQLIDRVKKLPAPGATAAWIAYESARQVFFFDRKPKPAYDLLVAGLNHLPEQGIARARVEYQLARYAAEVVGKSAAVEHAARARRALDGLPPDPSLRRLRMMVNHLEHFQGSTLKVVQTQYALLRAARPNDRAGAFEACLQMAKAHEFDNNPYRALRHHLRAARWKGDGGAVQLPMENPNIGIAAYMTGQYDIAIDCFLRCEGEFRNHRPAFLAVVWWLLGDVAKAEQHLSEAQFELMKGRFLPLWLCTDIRAQVDDCLGVDPLPALRQSIDQMATSGITGTNLAKVAWQIHRRELRARERWLKGNALLDQLAQEGVRPWSLMVDVAEAGAEAGLDPATWLPQVRAAALRLRRGFGEAMRYNPEGLVRCARLLQSIDPLDATSLLQVARRRVLDALPHVPAEAQDSFRAVPTNARLLADSRAAPHRHPALSEAAQRGPAVRRPLTRSPTAGTSPTAERL
jgi:DNA-binding SARP family transcriptional activator/tetratricopeptide (TPR) repeat protein